MCRDHYSFCLNRYRKSILYFEEKHNPVKHVLDLRQVREAAHLKVQAKNGRLKFVGHRVFRTIGANLRTGK